MAGCRIVDASVVNAEDAIAKISTDYRNAGEAFVRDLNSAISEMEGEAKDAIDHFINTDVNKFVAEDLPQAIDGMSQLLKGNRENFEKVDAQIAQSISGG